ncbi:MAG: hypothetical protein ABUS57_10920 [Pseudomonadota bacterium]
MSAQPAQTPSGHFYRIRLELAREPGRPEGAADVGYTIVAPLLPDGHLDAEAARAHRQECRVVRFHPGEEADVGYLRRRAGGAWVFHYDFADGSDDDDAAYRLGEHRFAPGEYVTIEEDEGAHTYRVITVHPIEIGSRP